MTEAISIRIASYSTGFSDVPGKVSLNLYAQGCKNRCSGCHNPELQSFEGGFSINLFDMGLIVSRHMLPNWICWLGGDITYQEAAFLEFNKYFKSIEYPICLYTGRKFEDVQNLLENVDLVIDGPWEGIPVTDIRTNQRIFLKQNGNWIKVTDFLTLKNILGE